MMRTVKIAVLVLMAFNGITYGMESVVCKYSECGKLGIHILDNNKIEIYEISTNKYLYEESFDQDIINVELSCSPDEKCIIRGLNVYKAYHVSLIVTLQNTTVERVYTLFGDEKIDFDKLMARVNNPYSQSDDSDNDYYDTSSDDVYSRFGLGRSESSGSYY